MKRKAPPITSAVATIAESDGRSRGRRGGSGSASPSERIGTALRSRARSRARRTRKSAPRHSGRSGSTSSTSPSLECEGDLGGDVPRLGEGGDELGVQGLGARRRVDADRELGACVQAVLELGQLVEEAVGDAVGRRLGDSLEPNEGCAYVLPEV